MDFLLVIVVVVLLWILYQLLLSEEIRNPCSDKTVTDLSKSLAEEIPVEEEEKVEKLGTSPDVENKSGEREVGCQEVESVDFLAFDDCVSDDSEDIRYAEIVSKVVDEPTDHHNEFIRATVDGDQLVVHVKTGESSGEEVSKNDADLQSIISKGITEIASVPLVIAVTEAVSIIKDNHDYNECEEIEIRDIDNANEKDVVLNETKVQVPRKESTEIEISIIRTENDCTNVPNAIVDKVENIIKETMADTSANDSENIPSEAEIIRIPNMNEKHVINPLLTDEVIISTAVDKVTKHNTDEEVLCSLESKPNTTPVPNISVDAEVDIDVKEAKVFNVPDKKESMNNSVVSVTFSKNGTEIPQLVINSEKVIDPISAAIPEIEENKNSEINKVEIPSYIDGNEFVTEVQEMESTITDTEKQEHMPPYRVSEPEPNYLEDREYVDEIDKLQDRQMNAYVDNIQNLTNEIRISEIQQVEYIQRKLEFTEISDEEEIIYRNVTKRGEEEFTEEVQTKNESSTVVTNENIYVDQHGSSTTITKIINMSYTSEEHTTESIELKTFNSDFLNNRISYQNGEQLSLKSIQEQDNENNENLVEEITNNLPSSDIIELDNTSEKVNDNENMSLSSVKESDNNISLKKKPACGVFLFGGDELLSKIKTRRVIVDEYENKETLSQEDNDNWRLSSKNKEVTEYKEQVTSNTTATTSQTTKATQKTHTTQETKRQTMSVNTKTPDAAFVLSELLSSRTDDAKENLSSEDLLDIHTMTSHNETNIIEPITDIPEFETEALIHLNKDRVKGPLRRRRPDKAKE